MATGFHDSAIFDGRSVLARLSDSDEETSDADDSFNYLNGAGFVPKAFKTFDESNVGYKRHINCQRSRVL